MYAYGPPPPRLAWWPAITRSGQAYAKALNTVSTTVIGIVIHQRTAAGFVALMTLPGGSTISTGRKEP